MTYVSTATLDRLQDDVDAPAKAFRQMVRDRLCEDPPPGLPDRVVATSYPAFRATTLERAVEEISDHATSRIEPLPKASLQEQWSAWRAGVDLCDASGRIGLQRVAFPFKHERS